MTTVNKYRLYCSTESTYTYAWSESEPTACPTNTAHSIDMTRTMIIDTNAPNIVTVKEETTPTQGKFAVSSIKVNATQNQIITSSIKFPHPISLLAVQFVTEETHRGDIANVYLNGKDTIIGTITADVSPAVAWTTQNYVVGNKVIYNNLTYTCILNTVSSEVPTNATYWQRGIEISVSSTVILYTAIGYWIKLDNGTNSDLVGRVIKKNATKIYVDLNLTNSYLASSPSYIKQTIYMVKDFEFGSPWAHILGESKIGGASITADTNISIEYDNKSINTDKTLIGILEYLY